MNMTIVTIVFCMCIKNDDTFIVITIANNCQSENDNCNIISIVNYDIFIVVAIVICMCDMSGEKHYL